ncbi:unnamed protein product [Ilex paraguariensis]|uniref:Uncharacterized protein n=1 Tax=Ilex paraguariensis TaxID=185542 RepID=A0ABC8RUX2_9AQUA
MACLTSNSGLQVERTRKHVGTSWAYIVGQDNPQLIGHLALEPTYGPQPKCQGLQFYILAHYAMLMGHVCEVRKWSSDKNSFLLIVSSTSSSFLKTH